MTDLNAVRPVGALRDVPVDVDPLPEHGRLTDAARLFVVTALTRRARGERVTWDVTLDLAPTPNGASPLVVVYLHIPSAVLGEVVGELILLQPTEVTGELVDALVGQALERMLRVRSGDVAPGGRSAGGGLVAPRR